MPFFNLEQTKKVHVNHHYRELTYCGKKPLMENVIGIDISIFRYSLTQLKTNRGNTKVHQSSVANIALYLTVNRTFIKDSVAK